MTFLLILRSGWARVFQGLPKLECRARLVPCDNEEEVYVGLFHLDVPIVSIHDTPRGHGGRRRSVARDFGYLMGSQTHIIYVTVIPTILIPRRGMMVVGGSMAMMSVHLIC